jgi:hypothetical protein
LIAKKNSKAILKSSLIKLTWACAFVTSFLHFKHMMSHAQKQPRLHLFIFQMRTRANLVPNLDHEIRKAKTRT